MIIIFRPVSEIKFCTLFKCIDFHFWKSFHQLLLLSLRNYLLLFFIFILYAVLFLAFMWLWTILDTQVATAIIIIIIIIIMTIATALLTSVQWTPSFCRPTNWKNWVLQLFWRKCHKMLNKPYKFQIARHIRRCQFIRGFYLLLQVAYLCHLYFRW